MFLKLVANAKIFIMSRAVLAAAENISEPNKAKKASTPIKRGFLQFRTSNVLVDTVARFYGLTGSSALPYQAFWPSF